MCSKRRAACSPVAPTAVACTGGLSSGLNFVTTYIPPAAVVALWPKCDLMLSTKRVWLYPVPLYMRPPPQVVGMASCMAVTAAFYTAALRTHTESLSKPTIDFEYVTAVIRT